MAERTSTTGTTAPKVGQQLPAVVFDALDGGARAGLRGGRGPRVVFTPHAHGCAICAAYLDTLSTSAGGVREWGGSVLVILPGEDMRGFYGAGDEVRLLVDAERAFATGDAALFVADEWGEVYFASDPSREHDLPDAAELVEWARFIAIQCPECEGPEGPWRTL